VLSTSGNSANLVEALGVARTRNALTVGLLGAGGGRCGPLCDHSLILEETDSAFVQDAHQVVLHLICEMMEEPD
jgi:D-sedoheptulose 7-phosphate isomerase